MDSITLGFALLLVGIGVIVMVMPYSQKKDERKHYIRSKAQSYAFTVVVGILCLNIVQSMVPSLPDARMSSVAFLAVIASVYLFTLLVYRKKYGG